MTRGRAGLGTGWASGSRSAASSNGVGTHRVAVDGRIALRGRCLGLRTHESATLPSSDAGHGPSSGLTLFRKIVPECAVFARNDATSGGLEQRHAALPDVPDFRFSAPRAAYAAFAPVSEEPEKWVRVGRTSGTHLRRGRSLAPDVNAGSGCSPW